MSKTIEEIKEEFAKCEGYESYLDLAFSGNYYAKHSDSEDTINELMVRYAQSQTQEITAWKESMMKVHNELDLQGIAKSLGLPLGVSIAPQVLPKIKELQDQNAELLMTLETIASLITSQTSMSTVKASLLQVLTKHNHLKSNTNGN